MYNRYVKDDNGTYRRQIMRSSAQQCIPESNLRTEEPLQQAAKEKAIFPQGHKTALPSLEIGDILVLLVLLIMLIEGDESDKTALLITIAAFMILQ